MLMAMLTIRPAAAQGDPLGLIAPGLTADKLCPLVKTNPQAAVDAVASGAIKAYDQGQQAISAFANAMGAAVMAANTNGCINEVFEGVNQAIIKGGPKVEYVTGKALAMGVAQGVASEGGEILAKATAVVICRGGASASACAKAWNQAIQFDPKNGCAVLVKAFVHAQAYCSQGKAVSNVRSTVFKYPLGKCNAPGLYDTNGGTTGGASGSYSPQGSIAVSQGAGQTVTYPNGVTVSQGPGISSSVWAHNGGWWPHSGGTGAIYQGSDGQKVVWGRKMLFAQGNAAADPAVIDKADLWSNWNLLKLHRKKALVGGVTLKAGSSDTNARVLQGAPWWGGGYNTNWYDNNNNYNNYNNDNNVNDNDVALAENSGYARGGVFANSHSSGRQTPTPTGCWGCTSKVTSNSVARAVNTGYTDGPVVANSVAVADSAGPGWAGPGRG